MSDGGGRLIVLQPTLRFRDGVVTGEDGVDLGQFVGRQLPSQRAQVLLDFFRAAEAHERRRDRAATHCPAERQLRQRLAMARGDGPQLLHRREVLAEMIEAEHRAEQVQAPQGPALGAPVGLVERHARVERSRQQTVRERSIRHHPDVVRLTPGEDLPLHAAVEHVPVYLVKVE